MSTNQQAAMTPTAINTADENHVKPVPPLPSDQVHPTETTPSSSVTPPSSPKHILATLPSFLKKTFEKKHEDHPTAENAVVTHEHDANPGSQEETAATTTTTTAAAAASAPTNNSTTNEKRLSRTIMDLIHKTVGKSDDASKKEGDTPEAIPCTGNEGLSEGTTEHDMVDASEHASPSKEAKEPIIDHLRRLNKFFAKKPAEVATTSATDIDATTATDDNVHRQDVHPTTTEDQLSAEDTAKVEETKTTSLSRRLSRLAQNLSTRIKETNKKPTKSATSGEGAHESSISEDAHANHSNVEQPLDTADDSADKSVAITPHEEQSSNAVTKNETPVIVPATA